MDPRPRTLLLSSLLVSLAVVGCRKEGGSQSPAASTAAAVTSSSATPVPSSATGSQQPLTSGSFSALTYNVEGVPRGITQISPEPSMLEISPKLNGYDLVLVQEDFFLHHALEKDALHPFQSQPHQNFTGLSGDGLNRFSDSWFFDFSRTRWLDRHGWNDVISSKGFSFARHEIAPGVMLDVYNHHADAGRDSEDCTARASQYDQLERFILTFSANQAVIVGGDTNLQALEPRDMQTLQDFLTGTGLQDVARTLGNIPERIDRVLFRSGPNLLLDPVRWRIASEFVDASGNPLADHEAIHVDFEWRLVP